MKTRKTKPVSPPEAVTAQAMDELHPLAAAWIAGEGLPQTELDHRMLNIRSALYFALEAHGHQPQPKHVVVHGQRIDFYLYEADRQTKVALKPKDWGYRAGTTTWRQVLVASGRPTLVAQLSGGYGGGERRWTDTGKRLEAQVDRIVLRFEAIAKTAIERRASSAQYAEELHEAMRRAARRLRREREQIARPKQLRSLAADWRDASQLRAFLEAIDARTAPRPGSDALTKWLEWAQSYGEALDPLSDAGLENLHSMAEEIPFDVEDDGVPDPDEEEWRDLGMLDEYM